MAGIYIHVPFCRQKCHYCNFFSLATRKFRDEFLAALKAEAELTRDYLSGHAIETIYVGGGTPSVYGSPGVFGEITSPPGREVTIELNPEDVTVDYVSALKKTAFNRISLGVQSFFVEDLRFLNRSHDGEQAIRAVRMLQEAGYDNISIDLIFGIPSADDARWRRNLEMAFSLDVPHISAYALTVERGTPLDWMIRHRRTKPVSDETQVNHFRLLMNMARDHGFEHYEISNFARPGKYAVHNTNYWRSVPYLGLGPSAHSYNGISRRWNVSNLTRYLASVNRGEPEYEEEILTKAQRYNEYVMTSLRTMWGCQTETIRKSFGEEYESYFLENVTGFLEKKFVMAHAGGWFLTDEGKLFADQIAAELFFTEDQDYG